MTDSTWQPTSSHQARLARATLLRRVRQFFDERDVLEVETPLLSHGTVTDVYLDAFATQFDGGGGQPATPLFLQTSPEYAMKRLLCAQSGPIYQICKAFRHEGEGRWHNPEFTMLEWYRPGFDHQALMDEVDALLQVCLDTPGATRHAYQALFLHYLNIDPLTADKSVLIDALDRHSIDIDSPQSLSTDSLLQLLFGAVIEPQIGHNAPAFVYGFPASQAALARLNSDDPRTADRFELYYQGAELANGFFELSDASEQQQRFRQDNAQRNTLNLPERPVDHHLLDALKSGLPSCAGVALGLDRLLMIQLGASHIHDVLNFPLSRA
ncbi:elongation factor P--(R)-beta-lysine ligase [Alteromonas halophila]|uniref:Elongation factor P--(R)-beta-lysine ligase n=1 Tax=Alteromonas halophila TaxID=516698 RepID=A0A918JIG7_9ALTE|nr:elongation factor P--(R)-beta-lysine ligase [Alteromonas halophila]GGW80250.1 elongation factor P--(R)-beta-lysine ligase [Alteromonas halophila]